jgi:hypothetical protein
MGMTKQMAVHIINLLLLPIPYLRIDRQAHRDLVVPLMIADVRAYLPYGQPILAGTSIIPNGFAMLAPGLTTLGRG